MCRYDATEFLRALQGKFRDADGINWEMLGVSGGDGHLSSFEVSRESGR